MKAIYSNAAIAATPNWQNGCSREEADSVVLVSEEEPYAWGIGWLEATTNLLTPADLPDGWDADEANEAIDKLLLYTPRVFIDDHIIAPDEGTRWIVREFGHLSDDELLALAVNRGAARHGPHFAAEVVRELRDVIENCRERNQP